MWSRRAQCLVLMALASGWMGTLQARQDMPAPLSTLTSALYLRSERFSSPVDRGVELRFFLKPGSGFRGDRLVHATQQTLQLFSDWFGAFPYPTLTIVDAPWQSPLVRETYPGAIVTSTRWIALDRDGSTDRALIAALAREYWLPRSQPSAFEEGLAQYSAARAIDVVLQGRQYWSRRYLGGFLPIASRSLPLSSPRSEGRGRRVAFDELKGSADAAHAMNALLTLDRYIGWAALQQGLTAYHEKFPHGGGSPEALLAILNEQGGRDLSAFFTDAFRPGARYDYGIAETSSTAEGAKHRVRVGLRRYGDAIFSVPYVLRFADASEWRDQWRERGDHLDLELLSDAALTAVEVDPDNMLLLDEDRVNNVRRLTGVEMPPSIVRGAASWLVWLQDLMLTCSSLS